ncbi:MAG: glycosyltransferase family 2 protein [Candidatus Daviesbacteria bacterium]|nr:glycosyltransferase family 2 protein [Candidatus Daviesbacteria bacterium]
MKVTYSWILPIKNEAESLPQLLEEITQVMRDKKYSSKGRPASGWEIIAVNDASTDSSLSILKSFTAVKILTFASPQGKWAALKAGFEAAQGQIIITSDSDLQDDPNEMRKLLTKFNQGYDLVSGWRKTRQDIFYKVWISNLGNKFASILNGHRFHDLNSPFKIYQREVLENIPQEGSLLRFSNLFAKKLGYKVSEVPIIHRPRLYGRSKFGIVKYLRIIYDLFLVMLLFTGSGRLKK